jgi:HAD superfamily hydrolase (TIGR01459 family)
MNWQTLDELDTLTHRYQAFLVDAWGVIHDGKSLYPGAGNILERLIDSGKKVIILSNAARRIPAFKTELSRLGITAELYTDAVTSGDLTCQALKNRGHVVFESIGRRYFYLGPLRSRGLLDGLKLKEVRGLGEASFILNTGAEGNQPDASGFEVMLRGACDLGLPMICANPDKIAIRGGIPGISAGAIADAYERMGGKVIYFGKPHLPIYQYCFDLFPGIEQTAFVMIGDGLATDIKGANNAGIDSVFLASGIHHQELAGANALKLEQLFLQNQARPDYVIQGLKNLV